MRQEEPAGPKGRRGGADKPAGQCSPAHGWTARICRPSPPWTNDVAAIVTTPKAMGRVWLLDSCFGQVARLLGSPRPASGGGVARRLGYFGIRVERDFIPSRW